MQRPRLLTALLLTTGLAAQVSDTAAAAGSGDQPADWRIPIHTGAADPEGGVYGIWASGDDHKVSFHDGFCFVPVLGPDAPRNLPWRWQTDSVRYGEIELWDGASVRATRRGDWAYEYRSGSVAERYDLGAAGAEQSFVIGARPTGARGDLVVVGAVGGPLNAADRGLEHAPIAFRDADGRMVVDYGRAWVLDAAGRKLAIPSAVRANRIELRVPAAWLDDATFPVTIDPLVGVNTIVSSSSILAVVGADVMADLNSPVTTWVQYSRAVSATDADAVGRIYFHNTNLSTPVFSDVTASWSSLEGQVAMSTPRNDPARFAVALAREFPSTGQRRIRVYNHPAASRVTNAGTTLFLGGPTGLAANPTIGLENGRGSTGLLAWEVDSATHRVVGCIVDLAAGTATTPVDMGLGDWRSFDRRNPSVTRLDTGDPAQSGGFLLVYQEANLGRPLDGYATVLIRAGASARVDGVHRLPWTRGRQQIHPHVAAAQRGSTAPFTDSIAVVYTSHAATGLYTGVRGDRVELRLLDWQRSAPQPGAARTAILASSASAIMSTDTDGHAIAVDGVTRTHYGLAWGQGSDTVFARCDASGHVLERSPVSTGAWPWGQPTVSPRAEGAFTIGYLDNDFGTVSLRVGFLRHRDATLRVLEQSGLRGRWLSRLDDMPPHKGSLDYRFESALGYVPFLAVGLRRGSLREPFFSRGYPLRLDPASVVTVVGPGSNVTGSLYRLPFPIPGNITDVDLLVQPFFVIQQPPFLGGDLYELRIR